jgi:MFS family permease
VISASLFLFSQAGVSTPYSSILVLLVMGGIGTGLFASPNMSSIMGSVPANRRAVASALRATFFNLGYTISINAVVLLMTMTIPYSLITSVIASLNPTALTLAQRTAFEGGLRFVYLVLAGVNTVAIVPSLLRGRRVEINSDQPEFRSS